MAATAPFVWGSAGERLTPDQVERKRKLAEALGKQGMDYSPVAHWTQGAARVAQALLGGWEEKRAGEAEKANTAEDAAIASSLLGGIVGGGLPIAAAPASAPASAPSMAGGGAARTMAMPNVSPEIKDGIVQTASALGIDPVDLATTISYETGGTFDPTKAGPTTKWGQHRGLIQFGEPQAKQYGVDWSNPVGSQLGANGAVAAYLRDRGVKPGMGLMDIYSTINAGAPGLYNRSDAAAGGAPGTVADKVNSQMAGHRAKAQALFADLPAAGASPVAMESGQPGFAIPPGSVESIPGDDPAKLRADAEYYAQTNPEAARQMLARAGASAAPAASAPSPAPAMTGQTFNAIHEGRPLDPVFQTEGVSQPWMGTALEPAQPQVAQAPLPPPRPADLAMPQADMPAPDAVPAIGQMPPAVAPEVDPNSPDAGVRAQIAADAQGASASPFAGIAQALTGGQGQMATAAAPTASPAVQQVAAAVAQNPSDPLVRALTSHAASDGTKKIAMALLLKKIESQGRPQWAEQTLPDGSLAQRNSQTGEMKIVRPGVNPLDAEGKRLDIETKKKNLGKVDAPNVQRIKQPDGSEVAVQWDQAAGAWVPLKAPEGGNAVRAPTKLTESQSKDLTYFNRGVQALETFEKDADAYANGLERGASQLPGGNYLNSESFQKAKQSGRNFLASILRKDSGAAITENEEKIYCDVFLPQPGDKPGLLAQKREARRQAIEAIKGGLGTAEVLARGSEVLKAPAPASAADRSALEAEARRRGLIK